MAHGASPTISLSTGPSSLLLVVVLAVSVIACVHVAPVTAASEAAHAGRSSLRPTASGRFLSSVHSRRMKGDACHASDSEVCSGRGAAPGGHLMCCGRACTDVLASESNCGACGVRCSFGKLCCSGRCTAVSYDGENCGACRRACPAGLRCAYGMCGYA